MKKLFLLPILLLFTVGIFAKDSKTINVATYNIRYNNLGDGPNAWPNRKDKVKALVRYHEFDIFGTQEGLIDQIKALAEMNEFAYVGVGRDDGKEAGEHSAIFYRKDRFKLLDSGDFWLSETPEEPSFGWDARSHKRICSWAKFKDLQTKTDFYFFSVHFDHQAVEARRQSGILMVKKIQEIAGKLPVICVGDFNSTPETEQIQKMKTLLNDSYEVSEMPPYGPVGTFNSFNYNARMRDRIDFIFASPQIKVLKYGVLTDSYEQKFPSDHHPVTAKVRLQ